ncbi:hypothetical protein WME94_31770 [Sorangium sp. So ce429]
MVLALSLLSSEGGADVALGPSAEGGARALLAWSFQVPGVGVLLSGGAAPCSMRRGAQRARGGAARSGLEGLAARSGLEGLAAPGRAVTLRGTTRARAAASAS